MGALLDGIGVVLPDNARVDLAFEDEVPFEFLEGGLSRRHIVGADFYEIVTSVQLGLTTDATVANRTINLNAFGRNGAVIWTIPSAAVQTASQTIRYTWAWNVAVLTASGNSQVMPLPRSLLMPTYFLRVAVNSAGAADAYTDHMLKVLRIPTGPADTSASEARVATPLLV